MEKRLRPGPRGLGVGRFVEAGTRRSATVTRRRDEYSRNPRPLGRGGCQHTTHAPRLPWELARSLHFAGNVLCRRSYRSALLRSQRIACFTLRREAHQVRGKFKQCALVTCRLGCGCCSRRVRRSRRSIRVGGVWCCCRRKRAKQRHVGKNHDDRKHIHDSFANTSLNCRSEQ